MKFVKVYYTRAQGSFFERKRCALVDLPTCATPHPDARERAALDRLQATRLFWAMEDVVCDVLLRRGTARGEDRLDLRASLAPTRTRWAAATRRRGSRRVDSWRSLPLIGLSLLLAVHVGAPAFHPIDR